jgi:ribose transport system permease protein
LYLALTRTVFGTAVYAVGGNEEAARLSGINVPRIRLAVFALCGLCTAFATLILMARLSSAQANMGIGAELDAISAVVIGGTSLAGGEGTAVGTLIGAFTIGFINNGLNLLSISAHYQLVAKGVVIALAVILDRQLVHRRG